MTPRRTPARRRPHERVDEPTLIQFVVLSMLLHVLTIVLFGAPARGPAAGRGDELPGTLDVTVKRLSPESGSGFMLAPGAPVAPPSATRPLLPAKEKSASPAEGKEPRPSPATTPAQSPQAAPSESEAPRAPEEAVPRLERDAPEEVDKPLRPLEPVAPAQIAPTIEPAPQPLEPVAPARIERDLEPSAVAPRMLPAAPEQTLERITPPSVERSLSAPPEVTPEALPISPPAPVERLAPGRPERDIAPAPEPLRQVPVVPGTAIERAVAPSIERAMQQPVELPVQSPAQSVPAAPGAPLERIAPQKSERELAPAAELPAAPTAPTRSPLPEAPTPSLTAPTPPIEAPSAPRLPPAAVDREIGRPATSAPGAPATRIAPSTAPGHAPSRTENPAPSRLGPPTPEEEIFGPRSGPPIEGAPRIDVDAAKKRAARETARESPGSVGVLPFPLPVPPEKKAKEANAFDKAAKPDCRTAYAGMGLLAVPALVAATVTDKGGCRW